MPNYEHEACNKYFLSFFGEADVDGHDEVTKDEILLALQKPWVLSHLHEVSIDFHKAENLFEILDYDESGKLDAVEFIEGMMLARGEAQAKEVLVVQCDLWKSELRTIDVLSDVDHHVGKSLNRLKGSLSKFKLDVQRLREATPAHLAASTDC
jgi:hypothetical protein